MIFYLKSLMLLPATFLHELMHLVAAFIVGAKVTGFNLFPYKKIEGNRVYIVLGSVDFIASIKFLNFIIGFAPLFLWFMLWVIFVKVGVIYGDFPNIEMNFFRLLDLDIWWIWIISFYLIKGGLPSGQDLKISLEGIFSVSGFLFFLLCCMIYSSDSIKIFLFTLYKNIF